MGVKMAEILELVQFRNDRGPASDIRMNVDGSDAEIVIFPGVRVERQTVDLSLRHQDIEEDTLVATTKKGGGKRPRGLSTERK